MSVPAKSAKLRDVFWVGKAFSYIGKQRADFHVPVTSANLQDGFWGLGKFPHLKKKVYVNYFHVKSISLLHVYLSISAK